MSRADAKHAHLAYAAAGASDGSRRFQPDREQSCDSDRNHIA
jgi:hypothetical protein